MNSEQKLFSIRNYHITVNHLLIFLVLSLSFSISISIRSIPSIYGWELNEFDSFFNYRATEYIVENGLEAYFAWNDSLSWYPYGRDVSNNSQITLHITTAIAYQIFGINLNLYDFTILFPPIIGSLTTIVIFALVRIIGGTRSGLFAALLFSISIPIIVRGTIGWFKSEPLGLFFGLLMLYFFLSGIFSNRKKNVLLRLSIAGILLPLSINAWGGNQFFLLIIVVYIFSLVFIKRENNNLVLGIPLFNTLTIISSLIFERPALEFVSGLYGVALILSSSFFIISFFINKKSNPQSKNRNCVIFLVTLIILSFLLITINNEYEFLGLPTHRYLNVINPFLTTTDPLVDSVAEHSITQLHNSFIFHGVLLLFSGLGIWILFTNLKDVQFRDESKIILLILGIIGAYIGATFMRLEVFTSISLIIISSITISILIEKSKLFFMNKKIKHYILVAGLMFILFIPLLVSGNNSVFAFVDVPPTILNGGTSKKVSTTDWNDALIWVKNNTPQDSVIASWWDYGYWIQTKSERSTLADNSTVIDHVIKKIAQILLSEPRDAWNSLNSLEADYIIINVSGERLGMDGINGEALYLLGGGGDESKKYWFIKIAEEPLQKYLLPDAISGTDYFWNNTLLGKLIPFKIVGYVDPLTGQQYLQYVPGTIGVYEKQIKFEENDSFKLVYSSNSFDADYNEQIIGVLVYQINKQYEN